MSSYFWASPGKVCHICCDCTALGGTHQINTDRNGPLMNLQNSDSTSYVSPGMFTLCVCVCVWVRKARCKTLQEQQAVFEHYQHFIKANRICCKLRAVLWFHTGWRQTRPELILVSSLASQCGVAAATEAKHVITRCTANCGEKTCLKTCTLYSGAWFRNKGPSIKRLGIYIETNNDFILLFKVYCGSRVPRSLHRSLLKESQICINGVRTVSFLKICVFEISQCWTMGQWCILIDWFTLRLCWCVLLLRVLTRRYTVLWAKCQDQHANVLVTIVLE